MSSAYLLISHGSRDPRPQLAIEKLAELVQVRLATQEAIWTVNNSDRTLTHSINRSVQQLDAEPTTLSATLANNRKYPLVGTAVLELAPLPLYEQIQQFAQQALDVGCTRLQILPLFLLPGVHVMEDIPQEVALAEASLGHTIAMNLRPHVGVHPGLINLLANQLTKVEDCAKILLAHGSRRAGANEPVETIAKQLGAVAAYWSVSPTMEEQVEAVVRAGYNQISILPYFLFAGGITDAIAQRVTQLQQQFPEVPLHLGEPMGATAKLAELIVDLINAE
ncbi:MAG TPA: sirohydrochlorin chelatase [Coleofasciculaceae cyanobacterium]